MAVFLRPNQKFYYTNFRVARERVRINTYETDKAAAAKFERELQETLKASARLRKRQATIKRVLDAVDHGRGRKGAGRQSRPAEAPGRRRSASLHQRRPGAKETA
jgi:hypothetical protein